ncbi:glucose-6-phosphate isomerase [Sulfurimonas sp. SWIR-19]|uniref:glucose-6-phosphate isomerase n=1 Tax=Sulfurimonas sp. SWIR-19 TaxID=2878390 RepID=UPI001CF28A9F|nr:glucose-6-phosphate isomerase [Sulfurimonas sp. SWIR-19]UCN01161.1 glucose-6-phosphate isomerase [Sulfurimonas sp. SWIR-19]
MNYSHNFNPTISDEDVFAEIVKEKNSIGYYTLPLQDTFVYKEYAKTVRQTNIVVIGIGGSTLGTYAIYKFLKHSKDLRKKLFFLETTDPIDIKSKIENIDLEDTLFIVISKSGTTLETIALFKYINSLVTCNKENTVIVSEKDSKLSDYARIHSMKIFEIPKNVGGRFSVFCAVGLLPLAIVGIDIDALLGGAKKVHDEFFYVDAEKPALKYGFQGVSETATSVPLHNNEAGNISGTDTSVPLHNDEMDNISETATSVPLHNDDKANISGTGTLVPADNGINTKQRLLKKARFLVEYKYNFNINVVFSYSSRLEGFNKWYIQLWGESLGKIDINNTRQGLTPIGIIGPIDQHSFLQLIIEGRRDKTVTVIKVENFDNDLKIPDVKLEGLEELQYLNNIPFSALINKQADATIESINNQKDIPCDVITIDGVCESAIAALMYEYELLTSLCAKLMYIDAYNQPGVENGKIILKKKLKQDRNNDSLQ